MNAVVIHLRAGSSWLSRSWLASECGYWLDAAQVTTDVAAVTCGSCKKTRAYKKATS